MKVYHGGYMAVDMPKILKSRFPKDFGDGFYISDFIAGILTREQFWVLAKFKYPTHQISFCNNKALKTLQFIDYNKIK
jgi:hypothetical protein